MNAEQAAWIRAHAWTPSMRQQPVMIPGTSTATYDHTRALTQCECMVGVCWPCRHGQHRFCDTRRIKPRPEHWLTNRPLNYIPPTAMWLADRACRSLCPCCPAGPPQRFELVPLFDLATA